MAGQEDARVRCRRRTPGRPPRPPGRPPPPAGSGPAAVWAVLTNVLGQGGGDVLGLHVEGDGGEGGPAVGADLVGPGGVVGAGDGGDVGEPRHLGQHGVDRCLDRRVGDLGPVGGVEDDLLPVAGHARGRGLEEGGPWWTRCWAARSCWSRRCRRRWRARWPTRAASHSSTTMTRCRTHQEARRFMQGDSSIVFELWAGAPPGSAGSGRWPRRRTGHSRPSTGTGSMSAASGRRSRPPGGRRLLSRPPAGPGSRRSSAMMRAWTHPERLIPLDGAFNFRDLGGYPAAGGGTTRWGTLFRSDTLHELSSSDVDTLRALGLATVIDLRTPRELAQTGRGPLEPEPDRVTGISRSSATGRRRVRRRGRGRARRRRPDRAVPLVPRGGGRALVEALTILGEPANYPLVFHCAAGKDRTGVLAALVLDILGVDSDADRGRLPDHGGADGADPRTVPVGPGLRGPDGQGAALSVQRGGRHHGAVPRRPPPRFGGARPGRPPPGCPGRPSSGCGASCSNRPG